LTSYLSHDQKPLFVHGFCRYLDNVWIFPQALCLDKIDAVLLLVSLAFMGIKLKITV